MSIEAQALVETIERLQSAIGMNDQVRINELLCEDFRAFENGGRMTGNELLNAMSKHYANGRRYQWSVSSPQIEIQGNLGVVVYENHGSIAEALGSPPVPQSWLETVVLRRQASGWRVAFIHSTRTKAGQSAA